MSFSISDLKSRVQRKLHGTTINKIQAGFYDLAYEAAENVLLRIDPKETKRVANIDNALYDQQYSYAVPTDLKGEKVIDIRPQILRTTADNFGARYNKEFDLYKDNNTLTFGDNAGVRTIRLAKALNAGKAVNECDSLTSNGTWAAGGNATSLAADTFNYLTGGGSLKFDISSSGTTAYIENSTMTSVDLSAYKNTGALFLWAYIPSTTIITSVALRWGSSSSNYYSVTATSRADGTGFVVGWNLLRFDWMTLTPTGTPVDTAITYSRVTFAYSGTATSSCRVDSIIAKKGTIYEMEYYSKYLFRSSGGTWKEIPTLDSDLINLDTESYNILFTEIMCLLPQEIAGEDASFDLQYWTAKKQELWNSYMAQYKGEAIKKSSTYYRMPPRNS